VARLSTRRHPGVVWLVVAWAVAYFGGIYMNALGGLDSPIGWPGYATNALAGVLFVRLLWWIAEGQRAIAAETAPSNAA
jgi:hypothetical protein